ncbi:MAG TPA: copper chaperone PCu(A)C [Steroidobacteraceae bacterium]|nr:copper chaperone PCu(A)C [Steroidobacteraceae bacterium]
MRGANLFLVLGAAVATFAALPSYAQPGSEAGTLTVSGAWVRAVPGAAVAAAYMTLHNGGPRAVRITGVRSAVAGHAMIHESQLAGGIVTMRAHEPLTVAAGASVELRPGGLHVMLHDLAHPLAVDEQVPLELLLAGGGRVAVNARVRPLSAE